MFIQKPNRKENDLNLVESSTSNPIRRPAAPIDITRIILEDLQNSLNMVRCHNAKKRTLYKIEFYPLFLDTWLP